MQKLASGYHPELGTERYYYRYNLVDGSFPSWCHSLHPDTEGPIDYMLSELQEHLSHVDVRTSPSSTLDYHERQFLPSPDSITYYFKDGGSHQIKIRCKVGKIIDRWAAPLHVSAVLVDLKNVPFVFAEQDTSERAGQLNIPHILVQNGDYVQCHGMDEQKVKEIHSQYQRLRHNSMTFMEYFLRQCTVEVRIRHILTYVRTLQIASGK